jgi:hypothetical protein
MRGDRLAACEVVVGVLAAYESIQKIRGSNGQRVRRITAAAQKAEETSVSSVVSGGATQI